MSYRHNNDSDSDTRPEIDTEADPSTDTEVDADSEITVETDSRYATLETGDGDIVIYDRKEPSAWLQSDHTVDVGT